MMSRVYTTPTDYDSTLGHFTIETSDAERHFLKIGAVSERDQQLLEVIDFNDYAGFYQAGVRIAITGIITQWDDTNGFEIQEVPEELVIGENYDIRRHPASRSSTPIHL